MDAMQVGERNAATRADKPHLRYGSAVVHEIRDDETRHVDEADIDLENGGRGVKLRFNTVRRRAEGEE